MSKPMVRCIKSVALAAPRADLVRQATAGPCRKGGGRLRALDPEAGPDAVPMELAEESRRLRGRLARGGPPEWRLSLPDPSLAAAGPTCGWV